MKILLLSGKSYKIDSVAISPWLLGGLMLLLLAGASWIGYRAGHEEARVAYGINGGADPDSGFALLLNAQRREWRDAKQESRDNMDALALRMGEMQSRLLRLDALGERLAKLGKLDEEEFSFDELPPRGGLGGYEYDQSMDREEMEREMDIIARTIEDRELKLSLIEEFIMNRELRKETRPSGYPVKRGWISSRYGYRRDPLTGRKSFHSGVDIPGRRGTDIVAVASGIVSFSGKRGGFGNTVEIRHSNGFVTRYAHNRANLVQVGDEISKGQVVALLGSSGRSTGPHLHFEVIHNGKTVNPANYLYSTN
jgi:murein DD-endopeptidase MepM/ murein hydrolase activator NlpD